MRATWIDQQTLTTDFPWEELDHYEATSSVDVVQLQSVGLFLAVEYKDEMHLVEIFYGVQKHRYDLDRENRIKEWMEVIGLTSTKLPMILSCVQLGGLFALLAIQ